MSSAIDTLTVKPKNLLKKTGDTMISGFLTLFQDPVDPLHAVTKRYVDGLTGGGGVPVPVASGFYGPTFASGYGSAGGFVIGDCLIAPIFCGGRTISWDIINGQVNAAPTSWRIGVYALSATTLLPTSLLLDAGNVGGGGFPVVYNTAITLTTTNQWIGLATKVDAGDPFNVSSYTGITGSSGSAANFNSTPFGKDPTTWAVTSGYRIAYYISGQAAGALPVPAAFASPTYSIWGGPSSIHKV